MAEKWCNGVHAGVMLSIVNLDTEKILLQKRKGSIGSGTWAPPGGWIDNGEHPVQTVYREIWEELGKDLKFSEPYLMCITNDLHPEGKHSITFHYGAEYFSGEPQIMEPEKIKKIKWFGPDALEELSEEKLFLPFRNGLLGENVIWEDPARFPGEEAADVFQIPFDWMPV